MTTTLELAQKHLALVAEPSTGNDVRQRSAAIAQAAANVAVAESWHVVAAALIENNDLMRQIVQELRITPNTNAVAGIKELLKPGKADKAAPVRGEETIG